MNTCYMNWSWNSGLKLMLIGLAQLALVSSPSNTWAQGSADHVKVRTRDAATLAPEIDAPEFADAFVRAFATATAEGRALTIQVTGGAVRTVGLGDAISSVRAIHRHVHQLVVIGETAGGGACEIRLIDWRSGKLIDRFWAYDASVSPDGSLVAFVRFYPVHFAQGPESQYRLYRLDDTPERNRSFYAGQRQQGHPVHADVGQPLDTATPGAAPRDNLRLSDEQAHDHLSRLFWSADSRQIGFIDAQGAALKAVVVSVPQSANEPAQPLTHPIDGLGSICRRGLSPDGCGSLSIDAVSLSFDPKHHSLNLHIVKNGLFPQGVTQSLALDAFAPMK
jgi:hypothetical protein